MAPKGGTGRGYFTQWAAQFAVASELCKRGYEVSFTMGNTTPTADLMVVSPSGEMFLVDVKGLYRTNPWLIKRKPKNARLFYVLAFVPTAAPNQFFVLSQQEATSLIEAELKRLGRPDNYPVTGFVWKRAQEYKDRWDIIAFRVAGRLPFKVLAPFLKLFSVAPEILEARWRQLGVSMPPRGSTGNSSGRPSSTRWTCVIFNIAARNNSSDIGQQIFGP